MIRLAILLVRFLFTHIVGMCLLTGLGLLFMCGGCVSFFGEPETQATSFKTADLEAASALPQKEWLRLTDACLVWPEAKELVARKTKRGSGEVTSETTAIYVPLVSQAVLDDWRQKGLHTPLPYHKVRVFVRFEPSQMAKEFPEEAEDLRKQQVNPDRLKVRPEVSGVARSLRHEDNTVVEGVTKEASRLDPKQVLVLRYGARPPTKGDMVAGGVLLIVLGLGLATPLIVRLMRGKREASPTAADLEAAALAGFREGVQNAVRRAVAEGVAAGSARESHAAREVRFYYMRGEQRRGPVPLTELRNLWKAGKLRHEDLVWKEGTKEWVPAATVGELVR